MPPKKKQGLSTSSKSIKKISASKEKETEPSKISLPKEIVLSDIPFLIQSEPELK